jgi:2-dehydro-3-deoxyphosphogluconate aldolase/(4S)-4-hydroxy-2-oxoglutarate aldolase
LDNVLCVGGTWLTPKGTVDSQTIEVLAREAAGLRG